MQRVVALLVAALAVVAVSGCEGRSCGKGTFRHGHKCLPYDKNDKTPPVLSTDPPSRTRFVGDVTISSNEPATIYYSTDGSVPTLTSPNELDVVLVPGVPDDGSLQAFAVDMAGNQSAVQTFTWEVDRTGPSVHAMSLSVTGNDRSLSWTNPVDSDLVGILVARVEGALTWPVAETSYTVGQTLAPGVEVVLVADADENVTTFTETRAVTPGITRYAAWGVDNLGNWGAAAVDYHLIALPAQTGTLTASAATGVVNVTGVPADIAISGSATYDAADSELSIDLTLVNESTVVLFGPKLVVTSTSVGSFDDPDGTIDGSGDPFRAFGAVLKPGAMSLGGGGGTPPPVAGRALLFTGVGPADVVSLQFEIVSNQVSASSSSSTTNMAFVVDPVGRNAVVNLPPPPSYMRGPGGDIDGTFGGAITPDGFAYFGSRNAGTVVAVDLMTAEIAYGSRLTPGKDQIRLIVPDSGGGSLYTVLVEGQHRLRIAGAPATLLRLDAATLQEGGRVALGSIRPRDMKLSPDGSVIAIATGTHDILLVDVHPFAIQRRIDLRELGGPAFGGGGTGPTTEQTLALAFSNDGSSLFVGGRFGFVYEVDMATGAISNVSQFPGGFIVDADADAFGRIWFATRGDSSLVFDTATGLTAIHPGCSDAIARYGDLMVGACNDESRVGILTSSGTGSFTVDTSSQHQGHWIGLSPF